MPRLFVPTSQASGARLRIAGAELRHLRTLRLGPGDRLVVFDEHGDEHDVRLDRVTPAAAEGIIEATRRPARDSSLDLVLAPALLKGAKMDLVVEKATELGVARIAPVVTERVVGEAARVERWRKIALAAAKQSGRTVIPAVDDPRPLAALVRDSWPGLRVIAWEGEHDRPLAALPGSATAVVVVVGPEGGLSDTEAADAEAHGFTPVTFGPRILRAETAAIVAVALCQQRWGDLSPRRA